MECSILSTTSESTELHVCDVGDQEYKAKSAIKQLISEESLAMERNSVEYRTNRVWKGSRPVLERIHLETWEGESKKSAVTERYTLLEIFKSCIGAFVKFWSERDASVSQQSVVT